LDHDIQQGVRHLSNKLGQVFTCEFRPIIYPCQEPRGMTNTTWELSCGATDPGLICVMALKGVCDHIKTDHKQWCYCPYGVLMYSTN
jgi:hypothetical protein